MSHGRLRDADKNLPVVDADRPAQRVPIRSDLVQLLLRRDRSIREGI
jgi:hypothetical protein